MKSFLSAVFLTSALFLGSKAGAEELRLAVTTSFNNSGLSEVLLPEIKQDLDLDVRLLVVGTGQALKLGRSGDVDAILVHSEVAEKAFVEEGYGARRTLIMYNDFVIAGPRTDPANIADAGSAVSALKKIRDSMSPFVSRGDDSGTHKKELTLWQMAGLNADVFDVAWYRSVGAGMGAALNTASGMGAYILTDRASWLRFANKADLALLYSGDAVLFNQYAYLPINPERHPHVRYDLAEKLEIWLTSEKGQLLIRDYQIGGETLFTPNAETVQ